MFYYANLGQLLECLSSFGLGDSNYSAASREGLMSRKYSYLDGHARMEPGMSLGQLLYSLEIKCFKCLSMMCPVLLPSLEL